MGYLTRDQMTDQIRLALNNRAATSLPDATIQGWMDHVLTHVCHPSVYRHPNLEDDENVILATGTATYNLAADTLIVTGVRNTTAQAGYRLYPQSETWFRERAQDIQGRPSHYLRHGSLANRAVLQVYPTPSVEYNAQVLEVSTYVYPVRWAIAGNVVSPIAPEWDQVIITGAVWWGWRMLNQPVFADRWKADFAGLVNEFGEIEHLEMLHDQRTFELERREPVGRY